MVHWFSSCPTSDKKYASFSGTFTKISVQSHAFIMHAELLTVSHKLLKHVYIINGWAVRKSYQNG